MWIGPCNSDEQDGVRPRDQWISANASRREVSTGFTLIELLIVVAIIAVIAALGIGAIMLAPQNAKIRGTEALIAKINAHFSQRLAEFDQARESIVPLPADIVVATDAAPNPQRARIVAMKRAMRQSFPEMFYIDRQLLSDGRDNDFDGRSDAQDPDEIVVAQWNPVDYDVNPITVEQTSTQLPPAALAFRNFFGQVFATNRPVWDPTDPTFVDFRHTPGTARAECLYMIVTKCGAEVADFGADEIKDTDGDGLPEFVDKFGSPIQFYLWPSYYASPMQNPGSERDADDPNQLLLDTGWFTVASGANRTTFERFMHTVSHFRPSTTGNVIQPKGFLTRPLIVSAGPDGGFGFWGDPTLKGEDGVMGTLDDTDPTGPTQKRYPAIGWMLSVGPNGMVDPTSGDDGQPVVSGQPLRISAALRISDVFASTDPNMPDGYGQDQDNIDNHHLRVK